jgi:hypothetical protein
MPSGNAAIIECTIGHLTETIAWDAQLAGELRYGPLPVYKLSLINIVLP